MNRRRFIQVGTLSAAATLVPALRSLGGVASAAPAEASSEAGHASTVGAAAPDSCSAPESGPFLELQGGPYRQGCSALTHYDGVSFERMTEDMIHHRMPPEWRDRLVLGIRE